MTVPSLFEFDFSQTTPVTPLSAGDIVRQKGWLHGKFDVVFPYWQLIAKHPDSTPTEPLWMCRAVPVSEYGGQVEVMASDELEATGLSWRVPSYAEVEQWLRDNWETNSFLFGLNFQDDGTTFVTKGTTTWIRGNFKIVRTSKSATWGAYVKFPPLPEEAELLELMRDLPWPCGLRKRSGGEP